MKKEIIYNQDSEARIDQFLKLSLDNISRTKIQKLIKKGKVKVDDYLVKPSFKLKKGQQISIVNDLNSTTTLLPEKIKLNIIYEDDDILAINKPSGLVVHPGTKNTSGTLLNGVLYYCQTLSNLDVNRPGIIHRLDKETSGLILIAKNDYSHYNISEQFANRIVKKHYKTIVWGTINSKGTIDGYIRRSSKNRLAFDLNSNSGKYSRTNYKLNYHNELPFSYVDAFPHTGRTHQIRVHFSHIKHPILNDSLYNAGINIDSYHQKYRNEIQMILKLIQRVALHAFSLEIIHPSTNKKIKLKAPIPDDLLKAVDVILRYNGK